MGEEKKGFWSRLVSGLSKTRDNIVSGIDSIFSGFSSIDDDFYEEIEEILIMGDIGVNATEAIIENLKEKVKENKIKDPAECKELLINSIKEQMDVGETAYRFENEKSVVLVIGVNGVGKTTSVGKLAGKLKDQGKKVVLAAADTFRAAAGDQLLEWANRAGVEMIGGQEGADPASIVYDAVAAAKARNADVLLCDTAGRLHNKKNLMEELKKINRILEKEYPDAYRETLVVLDATTGQNALAQARQFSEVAEITGIILTKMDGTAKGYNNHFYAIGNELDLGKFNMYLDFYLSDEELDNRGIISSLYRLQGDADCIKNARYESWVTKLNYRFQPKWNIFVKGMYENASIYKHIDQLEKGKYRTAYGYFGGIEYYPTMENLHFFASYIGRSYRFTGKAKALGAENYSTSTLSIGLIYHIPLF